MLHLFPEIGVHAIRSWRFLINIILDWSSVGLRFTLQYVNINHLLNFSWLRMENEQKFLTLTPKFLSTKTLSSKTNCLLCCRIAFSPLFPSKQFFLGNIWAFPNMTHCGSVSAANLSVKNGKLSKIRDQSHVRYGLQVSSSFSCSELSGTSLRITQKRLPSTRPIKDKHSLQVQFYSCCLILLWTLLQLIDK